MQRNTTRMLRTAEGLVQGTDSWKGMQPRCLDSESYADASTSEHQRRECGWDELMNKLPTNLQTWWSEVYLALSRFTHVVLTRRPKSVS